MKSVMEQASVDLSELLKAQPGRRHALRLSACEIYNEVVRDLLHEDTPALRLLDDALGGTVVEGAREEAVKSPRHLQHLLSLLEPRRQNGDNGVNEASSRSHLVVRLVISSAPSADTDADGDGGPDGTCASLYFVDLAGSERAGTLGRERLREGAAINRSLLTLSTVIRKLAAGGRGSHVPYRDSKLTRLLAHALGGNSRCAVVLCASPARGEQEATRASLFFGENAKRVVNHAAPGVAEGGDERAQLRRCQAEIARLRSQLRTARSVASGEDLAAALRASPSSTRAGS
jgi:centromeric protein E